MSDHKLDTTLGMWSLLTISEAAALYCVQPNTIRYHLDRGRLQYRKTDRVYLITFDSLRRLYGEPQPRYAAQLGLKTVDTSLHPAPT